MKDLRKESFGPPKYEPLLVKLLKQVFDPSRPDLHPDVEHISTGLMDLLKSGFSMFKKVKVFVLVYFYCLFMVLWI